MADTKKGESIAGREGCAKFINQANQTTRTHSPACACFCDLGVKADPEARTGRLETLLCLYRAILSEKQRNS
jgi:hypothetical protein